MKDFHTWDYHPLDEVPTRADLANALAVLCEHLKVELVFTGNEDRPIKIQELE